MSKSNSLYVPKDQEQQNYPHESSQPFKKQPNVIRQRQMIEEFQRIIILYDEENKKLSQQIAKVTQKEKNTTLYYQTKISQLQAIIQSQTLKIEVLEQQKFKKDQNMIQSKMVKSNVKSSKYCLYQEYKENINTLNSNNQLCNNQLCFSRDEQIKKQLTLICKSLDHLLQFLQIRRFQTDQIYVQYSREFQHEKQRRKDLSGKDSVSILKNIQHKMNNLEYIIKNISCYKQFSHPLLVQIKKIKKIQESLLKIPFLEKINPNEVKEKNEEILAQAKMSEHNILSIISNRVE